MEKKCNPVGPPLGSVRVYRGGSWIYDAKDCRSAHRDKFFASYRNYYLGFRVVVMKRSTRVEKD